MMSTSRYQRAFAAALSIFLFGALTPTRRAMADEQGRLDTLTAKVTEAGFVVRASGGAHFARPRIRTDAGLLRLWFPDMRTRRLEVEGDGAAVERVSVRAGYSDTALLLIHLSPETRVPLEDLRVETAGRSVTVTVARGALPLLGRPTDAPAPAAADSPSEAAPSPPAAAPAPSRRVAATAATPAEPLALATARPAASAALEPQRAAVLPLASSHTSTWALVFLAALLGVIYLLLRLYQQRAASQGVTPQIEVVAVKRLGARHQLLVVRALGQDHLLSVLGGRTEKLASMPSPAAAPEPNKEERRASMLKLIRDAEPEPERPGFGAELLRAAEQRQDRVTLNGAPKKPSVSEAVAGLLSLRQRAGR